ncbi:bifunctional 5,10-methylenetetrahydrofolate dehydrogenase/5,10-methenyltetrahydrofolate cyclohydrolase [Candidatus Saccharibacteria bacterium]|nr:bifunctional 5,10-methylenetetrahydrofolate dehydrogenase/5,10-methenyltetrahydrofolate cyclohydrolase [Candidatus Saccharibacteria bacterium]
MKLLSGSELVDFIKERQAKQVRNLKQAHHIAPNLAIVRCDEGNKVIDTYMRLKRAYGDDIGVTLEVHDETPKTVMSSIQALNEREDVHGIIVQFPVFPTELGDALVEAVDAAKDVDGLSTHSSFDPATPTAILWLLAGYNVTPENVAIVGRGRLVGAPLEKMLLNSGVSVKSYDIESAHELQARLLEAKIIVTATGQPGLITSDMVAQNAVVVDAGTASEGGVIRGDVAADVRERDDLTITPEKGGVGPLTVAALFDNVILSARRRATAASS